MDQNQYAQYLVESYSDTILRLCYTYLKSTYDAQDVCQTVFLKLLSSPQRFEGSEHEKAWILRTTVNACKDLLKSPWRRLTCNLEVCQELVAPPEGENPVLQAVQALPKRYRLVIYLYYYEGYPAADIAAMLQLPLGTVHTRLARGREKIKFMVGGDYCERLL